MKKGIILLIGIVILNTSLFSQYFAPIGAVWHYTHSYMGPGVDYNKLTVIDTSVNINGKLCSKILKTISMCSPQYEYVYYENNIVFRLNQENNNFDTLYNFNLNAGEGWANNIIDSVVYENINGTLLKGFYINGETYGGPILERIGSPVSFISDNPACDPVDGGWIRCYTDTILGFYNFVNYDCEAIYLSVDNLFKNEFQINFNQIDKSIDINNCEKINLMVIYDNLGQEIAINKNLTSKISIDNFKNGIYFIKLFGNNEFIKTYKIVKY